MGNKAAERFGGLVDMHELKGLIWKPLALGLLMLLLFLVHEYHTHANIGANSDSCQVVWSGATLKAAGDTRGECKGLSWETFTPQLYWPIFAWWASILLSVPCKAFFEKCLLPSDLSDVGRRKSTVLRYIGTEHDPPMYGNFLTLVYICQMIFSIYDVFIFAARTYSTTADWGTETADFVFAGFFTFAYLINAVKAGFSLTYVCSGAAFIDMLTIVPTFGLIGNAMSHTWLNLKFLRVNRALVAYQALERTGVVEENLSELTRVLVLMCLKTMAIVISMGGIVFLIETLGEPEMFRSTTVPTPMGKISFIQMLYWTFTTISTVGYGDFSPTTNLSQIVIIVFIVVGVVFFSVETGNLVDIMGSLSRGHGKYNGANGHVLVVGGGVRSFSPSVQRFLTEMFASTASINVVMLSGVEVTEDVQKTMASPEAQGRLFYFQGSPMERSDLDRVKLSKACMVFVLADGTAQDADEEDRSNILRAINIYRAAPHLRMRVMILRPFNKLMAFSVGLPVRVCCSLNELKGNLMAQSCRLPGYSTLLLNLCITDHFASAMQADPKRLALCAPWQQQYFKGNNLELYGCLLDTEFTGKTFWEVALEVRRRTGDLLLAVQVDGAVMVFPQDHVVRDEDIVFVIGDDHNSVAQIAHLKAPGLAREWCNVVDYRINFVMNDNMQDQDSRTRDLVQFMMKEERVTPPKGTRQHDPRTVTTKRLKPIEKESHALHIPGLANLAAHGHMFTHHTTMHDEGDSAIDTSAVVSGFASEASLSRNKDEVERRKEEAIEAVNMIEEGGHILLLICQPAMQWQQVVAFIRPLRADYLPTMQNIVVMGPGFPPTELWDMFKDVAFVVGNPEKRDDLQNVGAAVADRVVLLAGPPNANLEDRLADSNAMIVNSVLEAIFVDAGVDNFSLFEYSHPDNSLILPAVPLCSTTPNDGIDESFMECPSISSPRFAAGQIFVPSLFGSLFANSFTTPGVLELIEALVMPSRRNQTTYPFMLPALERVAIEWIGQTYGAICEELLSSGLGVQVQGPNATEPHLTHCLPFGLYRRATEVAANFAKQEGDKITVPATPTPLNGANQGMMFVYANPEREEVLLPGDMLYVLAPSEWIARVTLRADAAELDDQDRSIFKDLANTEYATAHPAPFNIFSVAAGGEEDIDQPMQGYQSASGGNGRRNMCGM